MVNPNTDMSSFDSNLARQFLRNFMPGKHMNYLLENLQPGQFHIWYGNGNNGKSALAEVAYRTLSRMKSHQMSFGELLYTSINRLTLDDRRFLFVTDDDGDDRPIPAERLNALLDAGFLIILQANTLPIITDPTESLWARTQVIHFKAKFLAPETLADPLQEQYPRCANLPYNLMVKEFLDWIYRAKERCTNLDAPAKMPSRFSKALGQLKLLATYSQDDKTKEMNKNAIKNVMNNENQNVKKSDITDTKPHDAPALVILEEEKPTDDSEPAVEEEPCKYGDITIILQHINTSRPDDMLKIAVDPDSENFIVTWDQRYVGASSTFVMSPDKLDAYLRIFFEAARRDEDGYGHAQFSVPLFPTVMVELEDAGRYAKYNLAAMIEFLSDDWPCECVIGPFKVRA
jgi:hypothetical protein